MISKEFLCKRSCYGGQLLFYSLFLSLSLLYQHNSLNLCDDNAFLNRGSTKNWCFGSTHSYLIMLTYLKPSGNDVCVAMKIKIAQLPRILIIDMIIRNLPTLVV